MQVRFTTKEQTNKERQDAFLALTGAQRLARFLDLCAAMQMMPTQKNDHKTNNFVIKLYQE